MNKNKSTEHHRIRNPHEALKSYYSDEVEEIKKKTKKALKISILSGILAVIAFGFIAFCVFISLVFQVNPLENPLYLILILISIPIVLISVPTSWVMSARTVYLNNQIRETVNNDLRETVRKNP